jgi:hypothetical protein
MRRLARPLVLFFLSLAGAALLAPSAQAAFGFSDISVSFTEKDGSEARQAGSHPYAMRTTFRVNTVPHPTKKDSKGNPIPVVDGALRDLDVTAPAGFVGNPTAVPYCETVEFLASDVFGHPACSDSSALGQLTATLGGGTGIEGEETVAVYNMAPPPGVAAKIGFVVGDAPIVLQVGTTDDHPYRVVARLADTSQIAEVLESDFILWGNPADPSHDPDRGDCGFSNFPEEETCPANLPEKPFLTLPRSCGRPLTTSFHAVSWWSGDPVAPGGPETFAQTVASPSLTGCSKLGFSPTTSAQPTTDQAESPSGLAFDLTVEDEGIANPKGVAASDIRDAVVTFPVGVTANPSLAAGLLACSPADLARETISSAPGEGCPEASKVGTIEAETPVLEEETLHGALYLATPDDPEAPGKENPFDELIAQYVVIKDPELGLLVKQAGVLKADPSTGQLVATFSDLPPFPLSAVRLSLKEGGRSPLITPPACGTHTTLAEFTPTANPQSVFSSPSSFQITRGVGGGPCPTGPQPFEPGFIAGSLDNNAAAHTPFHMRLTRRDGDQDLTRFDATLPPGLLAKLKGVSKCPDSAIAAAEAKSGRAELASPSCPADSRIGTVQGGAGVGSQLTYVPGSLYLSGPVGKAPLSVVGIVPAVAGPFDVGTIVVRQALRVNPVTARAEVDGASSDPIPHILAGIPLRVRDIRVDVDRPSFTLNPTDCDPFATAASIWGGGADVFSVADDSSVARSDRFQAANCARLDFKPRLSLKLRGGTKRGDHPALTAVYRPRKGDANVTSIQTRLPTSAFLEQAHIRTICTRVQFAAEACPKGSVYGHVVATTPLLDEPLKGPVYLRSSNNDLPDMVLDLHGLVDVEVAARIDSVRGGIRATFPSAPDAPITKVVLRMQGAKKGLVVNSTNLCASTNRARVALGAQNGKRRSLKPAVKPSGCKVGKSPKRGKKKRR